MSKNIFSAGMIFTALCFFVTTEIAYAKDSSQLQQMQTLRKEILEMITIAEQQEDQGSVNEDEPFSGIEKLDEASNDAILNFKQAVNHREEKSAMADMTDMHDSACAIIHDAHSSCRVQ